MADLRSTLFVGNLSVFCTEQDILQMFGPYGQILEIRMAKSEDSNKHLSYGFVKFSNVASAQLAMHDLNDVVLCGRPLKVGKALSRSSKKKEDDEGSSRQSYSTASVHVTFISHQIQRIVTEESLRFLFGRFGQVVDAIICKSNVDQHQGRQSGYGFIHFSGGTDGVQASFAAAQYLEDFMIDEVNYKCKISRDLEIQLKSYSLASELLLRQYHTTNPSSVTQTVSKSPGNRFGSISSLDFLSSLNKINNVISHNNASSLPMKQQLLLPQYVDKDDYHCNFPSSIGSGQVNSSRLMDVVNDKSRFMENRPSYHQNDSIMTNNKFSTSHSSQDNSSSSFLAFNNPSLYNGLDTFLTNNHEVFKNELHNVFPSNTSHSQPTSVNSRPMYSQRNFPMSKLPSDSDPRFCELKNQFQQLQSIPSNNFSNFSRPQNSFPNISHLLIHNNASSTSSMEFLSSLSSNETIDSRPSLLNHNLSTSIQRLPQNINYLG